MELDKALAQFLSKSYNEDEDIELLSMLALLADPNNTAVKAKINRLDFLRDIYNDATLFSQDKEVQNMLFTEELAIADWNTNTKYAEKCGEERAEARITSLYAWLYSANRDDDAKKASVDSEYRQKLFEEYERSTQ